MSYFKNGSLIESTATTATAAGTTTLTAASATNQQFTGITTQTVTLPDATTLAVGRRFRFLNRSTGSVTVNYNDASEAFVVEPGSEVNFLLISKATTNGTWDISEGGAGGAFTYRYERYVDPINGSDTGDGTYSDPWRTVTYAMTQITDADASNVYVLYLAPGLYDENAATTITWKPHIHPIGPAMVGGASKGIDDGVHPLAIFTGITFSLQPIGGGHDWYIYGVECDAIVTTTGSDMDLTIDSCLITQDNNFGIRLKYLTVRNTTFLGADITIPCNGGTTVYVNFENVSVLFGNITKLNNNALDFTAKNCVFNGNFNFTANNNVARFYGCDGPVGFQNLTTITNNNKIVTDHGFYSERLGVATALVPNTSGVFNITHLGGGENVALVSSSTTLDGSANVILVDASAGAVNITLNRVDKYRGKLLYIVKVDASANAVNILYDGLNTLNGGTSSIAIDEQNQSCVLAPDTDNSNWQQIGTGVGSGGGAGGVSIEWIESANAPLSAVENDDLLYAFQSGLTQALYALIKVPNKYKPGKPINLRMNWLGSDSSGTALINAVATLIRPGTDLMTSTTNQRTTMNAAVTQTAGTAGKPQNLVLDISSATGQINGVSVSPGDLIRVKLQRGSDTGASDLKVPVYGAEVTFS